MLVAWIMSCGTDLTTSLRIRSKSRKADKLASDPVFGKRGNPEAETAGFASRGSSFPYLPRMQLSESGTTG